MSAQIDSAALRILIVDDHDMVRSELRSLLDGRGIFQVVGEAGSVAEAVQEAARVQPHVVIMDMRLPDGSGIEASREIRSQNPSCKVLMLTSYANDETICASILAGAAGYVLKQIRSQSLVDAIETVANGESLLDPLVRQRMLERTRLGTESGPNHVAAELTEHERKILSLAMEGQTNREISRTLALSEAMVKIDVIGILCKLNLNRRSQSVGSMMRGWR